MKRKNAFSVCLAVAGILLTVLGIFTLIRPDSMLSGVVIVYGIIVMIMGIADIAVYVRISRFTGFMPTLSLISGILSVMCGVMLVANPNIGKWAVTVMLPIWFIAHCICGLARLDFLHACGGGYLHVLSMVLNILGLILGVIMLFSPMLSFMTIRVISYMAAIYFIVFGIECVVKAIACRKYGE